MSEWGITTPTGKTLGKQKENINVWTLDGDCGGKRQLSENLFFFLNRETNFKKGKQGTLSPKQSVDP